MNSYLFLGSFLVLGAFAQEQCCSQPQPVVIQLSCGNNEAQPHPPPTNPAPQEDEWNMMMDEDRQYCKIDNSEDGTLAYFSGEGPLTNMPHPFYAEINHQATTIEEMLNVISPPEYQRPDLWWDGRPSTLGFPMPAKGTQHYNMLLCWPYAHSIPIPVITANRR